MATYTTAAGSASNVRPIWSDAVDREVLAKTTAGKLMGTGITSCFQTRDELNKGPGDQARFTLIALPASGTGFEGNDSDNMEGNEQSITPYTDTLTINTLSNAFRTQLHISQQRTVFDLREELKHQASEWGADTIDTSTLYQVTGYLPGDDTNTILTGENAIVAVDSDHYINAETPAPGGASNDEDLDSNDTLKLSHFDEYLRRNQVISPAVRPIKDKGNDHYIGIGHPNQWYDLQTDTSNLGWFDLQRAAAQGGALSNNPIWTGSLGAYKGIVFHTNKRIPNGVNSSTSAAVANTRRMAMLGAQSLNICWGRSYGNSKRWSWIEKTFGYEGQLGVAVRTIWGCKVSVYNSKYFGAMVLSTYTSVA